MEAGAKASWVAAEGHEAASDAMGQAGLVGRVKNMRGEEDLRHASLQDFREE